MNGTNGTNGDAPSKPAPPVKIRKKGGDPFNATRSRPRQAVPIVANGVPNGQPSKAPQAPPPASRHGSLAGTQKAMQPTANSTSGFTDPEVLAGKKTYTDHKLVATKRDLIEGLRYHIMQLTGTNPIDIRDPDQFPQPAHLHRRDPRAAQPIRRDDDAPIEHKDGLTAGEREDLNRRKEQRQQERAANLAQIAPSQQSRKMASMKPKTKQVYRADLSEADKRRIRTNYEEKLPWHLEDFEGKHCFIGENQATSANRHAALIFEPTIDANTGKFRLIPVEKVYEFNPKREQVKQTMEDVEKLMKAKKTAPEWLAQVEEKSAMRKRQVKAEEQSRSLFSGAARSDRYAGRAGEDADMDFDEDELFADDEEGDLFYEKDEDEALAEKRIKEDQKTANFFEVKEEREYDEDELREQREAELRRENFKSYRKKLEKHERNFNHGTDSEYSESSSSDSETERERLEQERATQKLAETDPSKPPSSALTPSGATTPSNRKEKRSDRSDAESRKRLKRPGSPNLSDASGTDTSTRKKSKKSHLLASSSNLAPGGAGKLKFRSPSMGGAGSGSDTDVARKLKLKHAGASPPTSTLPSRGPSPPPRPSSAAPVTMPTKEMIRDAVRKAPAPGVTIKQLLGLVPHPKDERGKFITLVKEVATMKTVKGADGEDVKVVVLKEGDS